MKKLKKTRTPIEVRYQETDQMGVVYHANYLVWFEIGRTKFIKELGLNYVDMEEAGYVSPVINANISYHKSVRYGEQAYVETWLESYDRIRSVYGYHILNGDGEIAVSGTTTHVIVSKKSFRPISLKKAFPNWHELYIKQVEGE